MAQDSTESRDPRETELFRSACEAVGMAGKPVCYALDDGSICECDYVPKSNLSRLLRHRRISNAAFAKSLGTSRNTVSGWINGTRRMTNTNVVEASAALDVSPLFLLDLANDEAGKETWAIATFRYSAHGIRDHYSPQALRERMLSDIRTLKDDSETMKNVSPALSEDNDEYGLQEWAPFYCGKSIQIQVGFPEDIKTDSDGQDHYLLDPTMVRCHGLQAISQRKGDFRDLIALTREYVDAYRTLTENTDAYAHLLLNDVFGYVSPSSTHHA